MGMEGSFHRLMMRGGSRSLADALAASEDAGLFLDFTDMSAVVKGSPAFRGNPNDLLTYSSPSTKYILDSSGLYVPGTTLRTSYDASGNALGLLVEEARTNLFLNSRAAATQTITVTNAAAYTVSFLGTGSITFSGANSSTLNGTGATNRVTTTFTTASTSLTCTVSGSIDYVQVERGFFATSPIVTGPAATSTRAADNISIATSAFPYSATGVTLYTSASMIGFSATVGSNASASLNDETVNNFIRIRLYNGVTDAAFQVTTGAVTQANINVGAVSAGTVYKLAGASAANDAAAVRDGGALATDGTVTMPTCTTLQVGRDSVGAHLNGHIKQLMYLPRRMSNAELQTVTT